MKDHFISHTKDGIATSIVARTEDIQREILVSSARLEKLMSRHLHTIGNSAPHQMIRKKKRLNVAFKSVLFSFSLEISSEVEEQVDIQAINDTATVKWICTIRLPEWFVHEQHYLMIKRAQNGWMFCPTIYRTMDADCPFFEACCKGDLDTIRMLLAAKQAFISDRREEFNTSHSALNFAIEHRQVEVCRFLVDAGILCQFRDSDYETTMAWFFWTMRGDRSKDLEILRLIEPESDSNSHLSADFDLLSCAQRAISDLSHSVAELGRSRLVRFEASLFASVFNFREPSADVGSSLSMLHAFLEDSGHVEEIRSAAFPCSWLLFALAADLAAAAFSSAERRDEAINLTCFVSARLRSVGICMHTRLSELPGDWQVLFILVSLVRGSAHWTSEVHEWIREADPTAFLILILPALRTPRSDFSEVMRLWILALHDAGIDLEDYVDKEIWRLEHVLRNMARMGTQVYGISHGPSPCDWGIKMSPPGQADVKYFWRGVETNSVTQELAAKVCGIMRHVEDPQSMRHEMPGRWIEEDGTSELLEHTLERWLACMEDSKLAQMESDTEEETAEVFYELWNLECLVQEWCAVPAECRRTIAFGV